MTTRHRSTTLPSRQRGAALVTALVFLIIVTAIALSAMRASTQELRMSVNQEFKVSALQRAQGMSDAVSANPAATPVVGAVGHRICTPLVAGHAPCDDYGLFVPGEVTGPINAEGAVFFIGVERLGSEARPPPRGVGSSLPNFGAAAFRVHSQYDGTAARRGRADTYEGVLVLVPRP